MCVLPGDVLQFQLVSAVKYVTPSPPKNKQTNILTLTTIF